MFVHFIVNISFVKEKKINDFALLMYIVNHVMSRKKKDLIGNTEYVPQHQIPKAEIMINGW